MLSVGRFVRVATVLERGRAPQCRALCVKVGDEVPISFMKGVPNPVIKEDSEYPDWVFDLADKSKPKNWSKAQLLKQIQEEGVDSLTPQQMRRARRLITLEKIKENNLAAKGS